MRKHEPDAPWRKQPPEREQVPTQEFVLKRAHVPEQELEGNRQSVVDRQPVTDRESVVERRRGLDQEPLAERESVPERETVTDRKPVLGAPEPLPAPEVELGAERPADEPAGAAAVETAFEPSPRLAQPEPSSVGSGIESTQRIEAEVQPEAEAEPSPVARRGPMVKPEPEPTRPAALSVGTPPPEAAEAESRDEPPAGQYREVPILIDLDPEDLEVGVVLKLRIAVRQHGARTREMRLRSWVDRAA
jgi:hypothetical protein